jgi:soluble lytic murein transglycosylase-like protein
MIPLGLGILVLAAIAVVVWQRTAGAGPLAPAVSYPWADEPYVYQPVEEGDMPIPGGHNEWDDLIRQALQAAGIPPRDVDRYGVLLKAIISHESGWNPAARGDYDPSRCAAPYRGRPETAGYCSLGLGQIHRYWHPDLAQQYDLLDPGQNIRAVAVLIGRLRATVGDDFERIAAAYNGGTAAGLAWPRVTNQVQRYVEAVTARVARWTGGAVV